jgi:uncharacterized protein
MSEIKYGKVGWIDLTISDAENIRDFYSKVAGWEFTPISMGEYDDYVMNPKGDPDAAAGICHARGVNEGLPAHWLIYINVINVDVSLAECKKAGGSIVREIRNMGSYGRYAVIKDPAGAYCALFEPAVE